MSILGIMFKIIVYKSGFYKGLELGLGLWLGFMSILGIMFKIIVYKSGVL
jgi:hypothetical protein